MDGDKQMFHAAIADFLNNHRSFSWLYSQHVLDLDADQVRCFGNASLRTVAAQDGDGILTRHELGGFDPEMRGVSLEPLHLCAHVPVLALLD